MTCGTASGERLPLYVVYRAGKVWNTWTEDGPPGTKYDCSKSGWFDGCTFRNWFFRILLPHVKKKSGFKVVFCDNLASHLDPEIIARCQENQVKFVFLPPNSTHLTQPLDVAFFRSMKRLWRNLLRDWKLTKYGRRCATLPKCEFPRLLKRLWDRLLENAANNLMSGFRKCSIVPPNVQVLLERLPNKDRVDLSLVGQSFLEVIQERRKEIVDSGTTRKRKATNIVAGGY